MLLCQRRVDVECYMIPDERDEHSVDSKPGEADWLRIHIPETGEGSAAGNLLAYFYTAVSVVHRSSSLST